MTDTDRIERIARHLHDAHAARRNFENLTGALAPASIEDAYEVQKALIRMWETGARGAVGGYKIALTSQAIRDLVGVDEPCVAAIFASSIHQSPATVRLSEFIRLGLEFELAFKIGQDVPAVAQYDAKSIRPYVAAAAPAFELIEDRAANYSDLDAASLVSDNAWCGGVVLGAFDAGWVDMDLGSTPVSLSYNDNVETAMTGAAMGNPLNSLAWLATLLVRQGRLLKAGDIVMSGSTLATKFAESGDHARYTVEGLGAVEVRIE